MPTNEERREVASSLKHCDVVCSGSGRYPYSFNGSVCGCMLVGQSDTAVRAATSFLADLIEPEPERTCHMTKIGGDRILAGWWECSECGPVYPPCKDEIAKWALQRCPRCGARVVVE